MVAGEISQHFPVSKPTMSAHFSVLKEADLVEAERQGKPILYRLRLSVLEDALLSFAGAFTSTSRGSPGDSVLARRRSCRYVRAVMTDRGEPSQPHLDQ